MLYALRPVVFAVVVLALAAAPAVIASGLLSPFVPFYDAHRHAAYIAITAVAWGALSLAAVTLASKLGRREGGRIKAVDLTLGAAALATLGAWIFSIYEWNIAKFGGIELDAVGPTTLVWPFLAIFAVTLMPLVRARRAFAFAVVSVTFVVLLSDVGFAFGGAIRDGSISSWGVVVGLLYSLELGILVAWVAIRARNS